MIGLFIGSYFFIQNRTETPADWTVLIEAIPENEAIDYLIESQSEQKEALEQLAVISFLQTDAANLQLSIPASEIEQVLSESSDLEEYLN